MQSHHPKSLKPLHLLWLILGLYALWFGAQVTKPVLPAPPDVGPGLVPIQFGNAGPDPIEVRLTSAAGKVYSLRLAACSTCTLLTVATPQPPKCPADIVYKRFALSPTTYQVDVYDQNGAITYRSPLDLTKREPYNGCLFKTMMTPRQRALQER